MTRFFAIFVIFSMMIACGASKKEEAPAIAGASSTDSDVPGQTARMAALRGVGAADEGPVGMTQEESDDKDNITMFVSCIEKNNEKDGISFATMKAKRDLQVIDTEREKVEMKGDVRVAGTCHMTEVVIVAKAYNKPWGCVLAKVRCRAWN